MAMPNPPSYPHGPQQRPYGAHAAIPVAPGPNLLPNQMGSPTKGVNTANFCRIGQETVHDIVQKTLEISNMLRSIQVPSGTGNTIQAYQERKAKLEDHIKNMAVLFRRLRAVYDRVNENCAHLEPLTSQGPLPAVPEDEQLFDEPKANADTIKFVTEEHRDMVELVQAKNRQLKEIIDQLRTIVWEINTMMVMRKT